MQIIVISDRLAKAKSVTLTARHLVAAALLGLVTLTGLTIGLYALTLRVAIDIKVPILQDIISAALQGETQKARVFVQQLSTVAGIKPQEFRMNETPGLGGAQSSAVPGQNLSMQEFNQKLATLSRQMENRTDLLGVLEAQMFEQAVKKKLLPTMLPVAGTYNASSFGMRIDPFTGQLTMHEGMDFIAETGEPIVAAAGGVVQFAGYRPQYGNVIDIDHGNDLVTRYAHTSKRFVKEGDIVQRGRKIGLVGTTGRSTGSHLHFEVRFKGAAQNPARFLFASAPTPAPAAVARR